MDDSCAVCAETLEWVAYGSCGHQEVCSTCVVRLRFTCDDRRCCLCKSESNIIFVTKALGDYTRMINDFSVFPADPTEGQVGPYWYHEGTQAYFDDMDHYKMIKAMCRLSCIVCDKINEPRNEGSKRRVEFNHIEQLKSHLFHRHKLFMCSLCLEGRKIFICEQKLYNKAQLNQHIKSGDSEVDGSESERGGFMGHPNCEFCQNPFYGDNELYLHMSTEHFTCHICQRQHPGQYEYFKDYDDLEIHFRQEHFLCEDEACLAKKFVVFATGSEIKRHNVMEHGGHMSRSKRNAALQIPIRFQYRRSNEQDRRGRGHGSRPDMLDNQLSLAIQASIGTANAGQLCHASSSAEAVSDCRETTDIESIVNPFELLATRESEASPRHRHASAQNTLNGPLEESYFPPLVASSSSQQKSRNDSEKLGGNTMAARLRRRNNVTVLNRAWPAASRQPSTLASSSHRLRPFSDSGLLSSSNFPSSSQKKPSKVDKCALSTHVSSDQARLATDHVVVSSNFPISSRNSGATSKVKVGHSASAPNLVDTGSFDNSFSNFPPVSASQIKKAPSTSTGFDNSFSNFPPVSTSQINKTPSTSQPVLKVEDVHTANKSLVEKIRAALDFDENKYAAFKEITVDYRKGSIDMGEFLAYVYQFGLSHLVLELARLCPDPQKQKELVDTYNFNMRAGGSFENSLSNDVGQSKTKKSSKKGKEKCEENGFRSSRDVLADSVMSSVKNLQSNYKPSVGDVEVLSKDGYRSAAKGKSKISVDDEHANLTSANQSLMEPKSQAGGVLKKDLGSGGGRNKQKKKTSKFLRNRLGNDGAALLDLGDSDPGPDWTEESSDEKLFADNDPHEALPVHGVWRNGGGRKLVAITQRDPKK